MLSYNLFRLLLAVPVAVKCMLNVIRLITRCLTSQYVVAVAGCGGDDDGDGTSAFLHGPADRASAAGDAGGRGGHGQDGAHEQQARLAG